MSKDDGKGAKETEEIRELDPFEVSLTRTPAVREEFIMVKNTAPTDGELVKIAKSIGLESFDGVDEDQVKRIVAKAREESEEETEDDKAQKARDDEEDAVSKLEGTAQEAASVAAKILIPHIDSLPAGMASAVKAIEKQFPPKDKKDKKDNPDDDEEEEEEEDVKKAVEILKSASPTLVTALTAPIQRDLKDARERLQKMEDDAVLAEAREIAKSLPGDPDKVAVRLVQLRKSLSETDFDAFVEEQRGVQATIAKSDVFSQVSGRGTGSAGVSDKVQQMASEIVAKSENPSDPEIMAKSVAHVLDTNPDLKRQYEAEMKSAAAATNGQEV